MRVPQLSFPQLRIKNSVEIAKLTEVKYREKFRQKLSSSYDRKIYSDDRDNFLLSLPEGDVKRVVDAGILTFLLHCEARIASSLGLGFYTIGPCGEELLGAVALHLRATDASALHYRHVATSITRQMMSGKSISEIALSRARGYVCSSLDPVTGGKHCSIGGSPFEFNVTSTLASQAPSAVGRALAIPLSNILLSSRKGITDGIISGGPKFPSDAISYVSLGDGSVNNAHFLTALNLAKYSQHRGIKCAVVFAISDNEKCISLNGHGWIQKYVEQCGVLPFIADGSNLADVIIQSKAAIDFSRSKSRPSLLLFQNVPRRFGHAATDRQTAYMTNEEIQSSAERDPLGDACCDAAAAGLVTHAYLAERFEEIQRDVEGAFDRAVNEPKISSREELIKSNSVTLLPKKKSVNRTGGEDIASLTKRENSTVSVLTSTMDSTFEYRWSPNVPMMTQNISSLKRSQESGGRDGGEEILNKIDSVTHNLKEIGKEKEKEGNKKSSDPELNSMRKHMTRLYDELLSTYEDVVYIGEDVQHGGYYLVTEGLAAKHPLRVRDFPPDETSLMGVAIGYSQSGLVPIVEIPYAKYLDCASDMFLEAVSACWLSNGKQAAGMMIRLQGFDKGIFGGNFHTHNSIPLPPGLDVVCYSNGTDYVRGVRYAMRQVREGRVVMAVDSTDLLNRRHVADDVRDGEWLTVYPSTDQDELSFSDIIVYHRREEKQSNEKDNVEINRSMTIAIVTYGNGVPTSLLAVDKMKKSNQSNHSVDADKANSPSDTTPLTAASSTEKEIEVIAVIDCPCISHLPTQLEALLLSSPSLHSVIFADVCKLNTAPLNAFAVQLHSQGTFLKNIHRGSVNWSVIGAANTYNPLGNTLTFLNSDDVIDATYIAISRNKK